MALPIIDNTSSGTSANQTTLTVSHPTGAGANLLVALVQPSLQFVNSGSVVSVSYDAVPMTRLLSVTAPGSSIQISEIWYLLNPPAGTHDILITTASSLSSGGGIVGGGISFSGANPVAPFGATATNFLNGLSISTPMTTLSDNSIIIDGTNIGSSGGSTISQAAGQTLDYSIFQGQNSFFGSSSYKAAPSAGPYSMGWSNSGVNSQGYYQCVAEVAGDYPAPASGGAFLLNFM